MDLAQIIEACDVCLKDDDKGTQGVSSFLIISYLAEDPKVFVKSQLLHLQDLYLYGLKLFAFFFLQMWKV